MTLPTFTNPTQEFLAFTHRSALNEYPDREVSNERMEFLGDAVLELSVSVYLYHAFPDQAEGVLTSFRASLVKTTTLARVARSLKLGERIVMSKGEEISGGRENEAILADTFEAFVGALFLDQGYEAADRFIAEHLFPLLEEIRMNNLEKDSKSRLQEFVQSRGKRPPRYTVVREEGPDHAKTFMVSVLIDGKEIAQATGKNKQEGQQEAAKKALEKLIKT